MFENACMYILEIVFISLNANANSKFDLDFKLNTHIYKANTTSNNG